METVTAAASKEGKKAAKTVSKHLVLSFGVSRFFAGDAISDSGPDDDVNFGFVAAQYTF